MEPDRWREVERLYQQALEHSEGERGAFLERACGGDDALHQMVESLLAGPRGADRFLERPALEVAARALAEGASAAETEADFLGRLRTGLADRYSIEHELGRGGMARVYLAQDLKHPRQVAIKVLRPDVAATIGAARFLREIGIASRLSHPHILPLHDSGEAGGLLYYVMPYIRGDSLRARLQRDGQLPLDDALQITREVADALTHAHGTGIVHRDIKPENILFTAGHAVVTDFGIARAISLAGGEQITETGIAIGTPAYMSPEQAAGSEQVDGRSDVYSLGCVLYEMLCGEPPFTGSSAQAVLAAHLTTVPKDLAGLRRDASPAVAHAVARVLAKEPAARLEAAAFRDAIAPLAADAAERRRHPVRVAGLYGLAAALVFGIGYSLTMRLGLPNWVVLGCALLLLAGFPIIVATGAVERRRAVARAVGISPPDTGIKSWLSWQRALAGGAIAFGALGLGTAAYMAMRLLGIGPVGTLIAGGALRSREPLILADFTNRTADSTLGPSLTTAFRVDLAESPVVRLLDPATIADVLRRAQRAPNAELDGSLARELAERENVKAIVQGDIDPVGKGYILTASIIGAADGRVLAAVREDADDDGGLIRAVDRLSKKLRERIGESLRSIRAGPPLEQVTTPSLDALRKYSEGTRASIAGDWERALAAYREATAIDTGFAMAYRKIARMLDATGDFNALIYPTERAFALRERLPELERHLVSAFYYSVYYDPTQLVGAYRSALERDPDNPLALHGLAMQLIAQHQFQEAESLGVRAMLLDTIDSDVYAAIVAQVMQGRFVDAETTFARFARTARHRDLVLWIRVFLASAEGAYPAAEQAARALRAEVRSSPTYSAQATVLLAAAEAVQGKLSRAERDLAELMELSEARGHLWYYFLSAMNIAQIELRFRKQSGGELDAVEAALRRHPLATMPPLNRPYVGLSRISALAGRLDEAARLLAEYERTVPGRIRRGTMERHAAEGDLLLARGRITDAIERYRAWTDSAGADLVVNGEQSASEEREGLFQIARAYEQAHRPDSAVTYYERLVTGPSFGRVLGDQFVLAPALRRLAELYEARGDRVKAGQYYGRFVDLWKEADPELQPAVSTARAALKRLSGESR